jgi:hypothetical protein
LVVVKSRRLSSQFSSVSNNNMATLTASGLVAALALLIMYVILHIDVLFTNRCWKHMQHSINTFSFLTMNETRIRQSRELIIFWLGTEPLELGTRNFVWFWIRTIQNSRNSA